MIETKTIPVETPTKVEPVTVPDTDPDRRLNPDRLCPTQKKEIVRIIRGL